jgi:hypothetical protein
MNGAALQAKIAKALAKLGATHKTVYLRTVSVTGGNSVLGIGQTKSNSDTELDPQPAVTMVDSWEIANSGGLLQLGDYKFTMAGTVEEATLRGSLVVYGEDVLKVISYKPSVINGTVVAWEVLARTVKGV